MKHTGLAVLAAAAGAAFLAAPRPAIGQTETFTATVLRSSDMRRDATATWSLTFNIRTWTSPEELRRLATIVKESGPDALLRELQKGKDPAGWIVGPALSREPSWRVAVATSVDTPRGRVVRLLTDRPLGFAEVWSGARSRDYEFAVFEFTLDGKGRGEGVAIPAARLAEGWDGQLELEMLPYVTGPDRLIGVRSWSDAKPGD